MSNIIQISDDEDNLNSNESILTWDGDITGDSFKKNKSSVLISSDEEFGDSVDEASSCNKANNAVAISSDEDELPNVDMKKVTGKYIKQLFPSNVNTASTSKVKVEPKISQRFPTYISDVKVKDKGVTKMIGGVEVCLPVNPYPSQIALMFKIIEAMKWGKNCLLESPTGSGKTLALLCGALASQLHEKNTKAKTCAEESLAHHQQLNQIEGAAEYIATPKKENLTPEKLFTKNTFGSKSIYDQPSVDTRASKREDCMRYDDIGESPDGGQVRIHKKARFDSPSPKHRTNSNTPVKSEFFTQSDKMELCSTPEKPIVVNQPLTPESVRDLYNLVENLQLKTSMLVSCSTPTIYYGARTHKQLEQVIKEFKSTWYCGEAKMTLLSSREYSCIREFDRQLWGNKNEMCRGCVKSFQANSDRNKKESNCKYFDNRMALNRRTLPPAFDLEDLVTKGNELNACPFYASRALESDADIVFCPYNYLIDPSIRDSLQIKLEGNILIIDEAHNIEDICRDAATYTVTREQIANGIKELEVVSSYRFQNDETMNYVQTLLRSLTSFEQWFTNQMPLVNKEPVNNGEASYKWEVQHFVQTLNNHNIGQKHYMEFARAAEVFCSVHRDNPRAVVGASQATATLVANIAAALGYLFRDDGKHMDDFKPILIRQLTGNFDDEQRTWRSSQFNKSIESESYSLKFLCLNPAVVFSTLKCAKCIILASGTLTPMISFHSELGTEFPLKISPNHIIPRDRVWIGTLMSGQHGDLTCTSRNIQNSSTQDDIGGAVRSVCEVTPHGVLCFMPSYHVLNTLVKRWKETNLWRRLEQLKQIYQEGRDVHKHNKIMEEFQERVCEGKGALLLAVYRGKVSEGMDFKDRQARAVITIGIPFPNTYDVSVVEKKTYNNKYAKARNLLSGDEWLKVQAYRALNQAVGRCVRHRADWGAVLMIDARFHRDSYTMHLSQWVRNFLGSNHHTLHSLTNSSNGLKTFMDYMTMNENEN